MAWRRRGGPPLDAFQSSDLVVVNVDYGWTAAAPSCKRESSVVVPEILCRRRIAAPEAQSIGPR